MSAISRMRRLETTARRHGRQAHALLGEMSDAHLLRNLARLETVYRQVIDGLEPDYRLCGRVDALLDASDVAGAWALLERHNPIVN